MLGVKKASRTSRLIIKGLPPKFTSLDLRSHFEKHSPITDALVITRDDGASRMFGFVGYKTVSDAKKARGHFNNSYITTYKLRVEFAQPKASEAIPRPWSKYSEGSSANKQRKESQNKAIPEKEENTNKKRKRENATDDPRVKEFLDIIGPKKIWANDDITGQADQEGQSLEPKKKNVRVIKDQDKKIIINTVKSKKTRRRECATRKKALSV